jgi:hypothetical protein
VTGLAVYEDQEQIQSKSRANQGQIKGRLMIVPTLRVGTIGMVLEDECNSTVGAGLLAKAFVQPTSSYLPRRVRQQAGSYRNRVEAATSDKAWEMINSNSNSNSNNSIREQARSHR